MSSKLSSQRKNLKKSKSKAEQPDKVMKAPTAWS
jgi:hypothetical protein